MASFKRITLNVSQYVLKRPNEPPITKTVPGLLNKLKIAELENCPISNIMGIRYYKAKYQIDKQTLIDTNEPYELEMLGE